MSNKCTSPIGRYVKQKQFTGSLKIFICYLVIENLFDPSYSYLGKAAGQLGNTNGLDVYHLSRTQNREWG